MKTLSTGDRSTLGNWLKLVRIFFGRDSKAYEFMQQKIADSPKGAEEEVIADEKQLLHVLGKIHLGDE